jgi:protoheme IX farnesyltransferase
MLKDDYARVGLPMLPRMNDVAFSGKVVFVSALLLVPPSILVALLGPVAWPVGVTLIALALGFVYVTWPLWREVTARRARRGFLYSGPYLLGVVLALAVNVPLIHFGLAARF